MVSSMMCLQLLFANEAWILQEIISSRVALAVGIDQKLCPR